MSRAIRPLHFALFLGLMTIMGVNFAIAKIGLVQLPPLLFMALRFVLVAAILTPFVKLPRGRWREVFMISVTLGLIHYSLMFTGLKSIDAATAAIAIQVQVPFAAILAAIFLQDRLGWRRAFGMAIAFAGIVLISGEPRLEGNYLALAMVIAAAAVWSIANIQIKKLENLDAMTLNAWLASFAAPQLLLASLILEDGQLTALAAADWRAYGSVLYQALVVVIVGHGTWYWLLRRYDVNQAMPFSLLIPPIGVAAGVLLLDETLTSALVIGGLLTIAGVAIIVLRRPGVAAPEPRGV
jgi:O-acetylserine/cysteine efflux transporter